nr:MAG: tyrosine recombinase [Marsupenaeus japonicus endogenous nimavirus]
MLVVWVIPIATTSTAIPESTFVSIADSTNSTASFSDPTAVSATDSTATSVDPTAVSSNVVDTDTNEDNEDRDVVYISKRPSRRVTLSNREKQVKGILDGPKIDPNKLTCIICNKQYVKLKRHLKDVHKMTGKDLEIKYSEAKSSQQAAAAAASSSFIGGPRPNNCNVCGRGVRHMKCHLQNAHGLEPGSDEYRTALGTNPERSRPLSAARRQANRARREGLAKIPLSVQEWIGHESRGGLTVDGRGMLRNMRLVIEILERHSLTVMDLIEHRTVKRSYEVLYAALERKRRYKYMSINVILGHLKRFLEWACAEANYPLCEMTKREHAFYSKLCRRKGDVENMNRKVAEYVPTIGEMGPLIRCSKHRVIVDGLIERPRETLAEYSIDLIHAALAWPLIIRAGARTGVVRNLLVSEVLEAVDTSDGVIVKVKKHKTSSLYGPYQIGLPAREHNMLVNFIRHRNWESDYVFSTSRGNPFSLANIQRFMRKLFQRYGLPHLRIASVRKFLTTQAHSAGDDRIQEATASLLKHSMKTAKRDYKAMQRDRDALDTANRLSRILQDQLGERNDDDDDDDDTETAEEEPANNDNAVEEDDDVIIPTTMTDEDETNNIDNVENINNKRDIPGTSAVRDDDDGDDDDDDDDDDDSNGNMNGNISVTYKRRDEKFKHQHLLLIKKVFQGNINKKRIPSLIVIEKRRQELEEIFNHEGYNPKTLTKKIYESIRSQIRLRQ